jgi:tetraacyldisaccharide-1-P 4'-kinase
MTEKDAVKLCQPVATNLWYLPVTAHLPDSFVKKFLADVKSFIK